MQTLHQRRWGGLYNFSGRNFIFGYINVNFHPDLYRL